MPLVPNVMNLNEAGMVKYLKDQDIALYKIPERLELIAEMPMVAGVKMDKKVLQKDIAEKLKAENRRRRDGI